MNTGKSFEQSVKEMLKKSGFSITREPLPSADGGVDIIATYPSPFGATRWIIQCKDTTSVARSSVDQLHGTMYREHGHIGLLVTSGQFTKAAKQAAKDHRCIKLINGPEYQSIITPAYIRKAIALETKPRRIQRSTIENLIKIIEQEATPMTIQLSTPTKVPKALKKMINNSGSIHLCRTEKENSEDLARLIP